MSSSPFPTSHCPPTAWRAAPHALVLAFAACGAGHKSGTPPPGPHVVISLTPAPATVSPTTTPVAFPALAVTAPAGLTATAADVPVVPSPASSAAASPAGTSAAAPAAPSDAALQGALSRSLLREADLPTGFVASYLGTADPSLHNQVAGYGGFFISGDPANPGPGGVQVIIATLAGFSDPASAQAQAADVRSSAVSSFGSGVTLNPVPGQPAVAGAQLYRIAAPNSSGGQLSGFAIAWQHGRVLAVLAQLGVPPPPTADTLNILARKQDAKLRAAGQ